MSTLNQFYREDSGTNTVLSIAEFMHTSSGTPAAGLGASLYLGAENSAGEATPCIELQGYLSTVTDGAEVGAYLLKIMSGGSLATALTMAPNSMSFYPDTDSTMTFGRAKMGSPTSDVAFWGHVDFLTATSYAVAQTANGDSLLNCHTGRTVFLRVGAAALISLTSSAFTITPNTTITGDLAVNGGDFTSTSTTFNLINSTPTTVNFAGNASVALNIGHASAKAAFAGGISIAEAKDIAFGTTTGTKIGTGATQKIGFYGATPVVQRAKASYSNWAALSNVVQALVDLGLFDAA